MQIFVLPEAFVKSFLICLACGLIGCFIVCPFVLNLTGNDLMVYLNQASFFFFYKILIPRHNMNVINIWHISSPRFNPREIVCTSAEREEMIKMEEGMRERKERRELVRK